MDYAAGICAELPEDSFAVQIGLRDPSIIGTTLMNAIAKHAFRHIVGNPFMTKEFLNRKTMGDFGWADLHAIKTVADIVRRNVQGEIDQAAADALRGSFLNPNYPD